MSLNKVLTQNLPGNVTGFFASLFGGLLLIIGGCGSASQTAQQAGADTYYDSGIGSVSVNSQIESGFQSVRRIQNNTIYRSYFFPEGSEIHVSQLVEAALDSLGLETSVDTHSNAGSATVIFNNNVRAVLLTAAHTVSQPDTLIHFKEQVAGVQEDLIEAVSIKVSENRFVITDHGIVSLEIVNESLDKDLALLITASGYEARDQLRVLEMPSGDYEQIEWGSKIYALGYPRGIQMVSSGVISLTNHPHRTLLADLNINRGFSGGLVSSVNSETGRLEWIGMITSAMGENLTYLVPEKSILADYNPDVVYQGEQYIETIRLIHYGIGYGVNIEDIKEFIRISEPALQEEGIPEGSIF